MNRVTAFWNAEVKSEIDELVDSIAMPGSNKDDDSQSPDNSEMAMDEIPSRKRTLKGILKCTNHSPKTVESDDVTKVSHTDSIQPEEKLREDNDTNLSEVTGDDVTLTLSKFPKWNYTQIKEYVENECGPVNKIEMLRNEHNFEGTVILTFKDSVTREQAVEKLKDKGERPVIQHKEECTFLNLDTDKSSRHSSFDSSEPQTKRLKSQDEASEKDVDEQDPRGLYGLNSEYLKSLNIRPPIDKWVHVSNFRCDKSELKEVFELAGKVLMINVKMAVNRYAKVMYSHPLEAVQAISMLNGQKLFGQQLKVSMDIQPSDSFMLPKGLSGVGPGLGIEGRPLIDIIQQYKRYILGKKSTINTSLFLQSGDLPSVFFDTEITSDSPNPPSIDNRNSDSDDIGSMKSGSTNQLSEQGSLRPLSAQSGLNTPQISVQGSPGLPSFQSSMKNTDDVHNTSNSPKASIEQIDVKRPERSDKSGSPGPPGVNPPNISSQANVGRASFIRNSARFSGSNSVGYISGQSTNPMPNPVQSVAPRAISFPGNVSEPVRLSGPVCPTMVPGPGRPGFGSMGPSGPMGLSGTMKSSPIGPPGALRPVGPSGPIGPRLLGTYGPVGLMSSVPMGSNSGPPGVMVSSAMRTSVPMGPPGGMRVPGLMGPSGPICPPGSMGPPGTIRPPGTMGPSNTSPGFGFTGSMVGPVRPNRPCGPVGSMIRDPGTYGSTPLNNRPRMEPPFTSTTVQFSNLPLNTTFPVMCEKLSSAGQIMSLQFTTPGCVVATFAHPAQAEKCIHMFNKIRVNGNLIEVKYVPK